MEIEGEHGFRFLAGDLTDGSMMRRFPSNSTPSFVSQKDRRAFELGKRLSTEFDIVLHEKQRKRPVTCRVAVLPIASLPSLHSDKCMESGSGAGVYFAVCFQQLFVQPAPPAPPIKTTKTEYVYPSWLTAPMNPTTSTKSLSPKSRSPDFLQFSDSLS
jgi:hypothetical protein